MFKQHRLPTLLALILVAFVAVYLYRTFVVQFLTLQLVIDWVQSSQNNLVLITVFYLVFIVLLMFSPISLFPIIGGVLLNFKWALPLNLLATSAGALIPFLLTRSYGRSFVQRRLSGRWSLVDDFASREGLLSVLLVRITGIPPFLFANYLFGLSGIKVRDYILGTFIGTLPWLVLITYGAHSLWEAVLTGGHKGFQAALLKLVGPLSVVSVIVLISTVVGWVLRRNKTGPE